eukprot:390625-Prorocentrum_minimum.AAC.2
MPLVGGRGGGPEGPGRGDLGQLCLPRELRGAGGVPGRIEGALPGPRDPLRPPQGGVCNPRGPLQPAAAGVPGGR